jgi:hypothetical protein
MAAELARAFISFVDNEGLNQRTTTDADPLHRTMTDRRFGGGAKRSTVDSGRRPRLEASAQSRAQAVDRAEQLHRCPADGADRRAAASSA